MSKAAKTTGPISDEKCLELHNVMSDVQNSEIKVRALARLLKNISSDFSIDKPAELEGIGMILGDIADILKSSANDLDTLSVRK